MSEKKIQTTEEYISSMHRFGRIWGTLSVAVMMSMPIIAGIYFDAMPSIAQIMTASLGLLAIFVPIAISEVVSYTPILGSSIYLTLVTGNVMNLKIPVVNNALQILDIQYGSEDADVISSIAVSISSFITVLVIAAGVILMVPLEPVLSMPAVKTATTYVMPALFGAMSLSIFSEHLGGGVKAKGRMKGAVVPGIIVFVLTILDQYIYKTGLISMMQGILILILLPITYFGTKWLYKNDKIKVILPDEAKQK